MKKYPSKEDLNRLLDYFHSQNFIEAEKLAKYFVNNYPDFPFGWKILGVLLKKKRQFLESINASLKAIKITPLDPELYNNIGLTYLEINKFSDAVINLKKAVNLKKDYYEAFYNLGFVLEKLGKLETSIKIYNEAIKIKPDYIYAYNNLGQALYKLENFKEAENAYKKALSLNPNLPELYNNLGQTLHKLNRLIEAKENCLKAISLNPKLAEAYCNLGLIFYDLSKFKEAEENYKKSISIKQNLAEAYCNYGLLLQDLGKMDEAENFYNQAIKFKPNYYDAFNNLGNLPSDLNRLDEAINSYKNSIRINKNNTYALSQLIHQQKKICEFDDYDKNLLSVDDLGVANKSIPPFFALSWHDAPEKQLRRSKLYANENFREINTFKSNKIKSLNNKIKVGYFSNDFYNHAIMYLMSGMLENHNHKIFEIFIFSYGPNKNDLMNKKAREFSDHYIDIRGLSINEILEITKKIELDIAIDLKGYTNKTLTKIFQYRIAPIQINFLGYPGTLGVDFIDYIIADPIIIPEDQKHFYHEKIIYLPHTYQPNDNKREIADLALNRADFNLPNSAFVFCSFNNSYKISPQEFKIWMRLLKKVNHSILWLFKSNKWMEINLKKHAQSYGIEDSRIIFAEMLDHSKHLARIKCADLFLDTFNYNAHTTASDALWSCVPVVTKQGKQFSARVAASLLNAIVLPELITQNEKEYEELILKIALNPKILEGIKNKLENNRLSKPLFDTKRYTKNFEKALLDAHKLYLNFGITESFKVKD